MPTTARMLACIAFATMALPELALSQGTAAGPVAYVAAGTRCEDVFVRTKAGVSFSKNVDPFAPAFIVNGRKLNTPTTSCRLQQSSSKKDVREFRFECATSVSYAPVKVWFRRDPDGTLIRQLSETETLGHRYEVCKL